jgi:hypothetical protein
VNENENYGYTALIAASLEIATKKGEQGITTYGRRLFSLASQNKERLFPCSLAHAQPCSPPALLTSSLAHFQPCSTLITAQLIILKHKTKTV